MVKVMYLIEHFVNKYRFCSLQNLVINFPRVTKQDIKNACYFLMKKRRMFFYYKDNLPDDKIYCFSVQFNYQRQTEVFGNTEEAVKMALNFLGIFRRKYEILYEEPSFFPTVIKYGYKNTEGHDVNAQIVYVPFSEGNAYAKHMGSLFDKTYDDTYNPVRFVIVESMAMLNNQVSVKEIYQYIPNILLFVYLDKKKVHSRKMKTISYFPYDLGVGD